LNNLTGGTVGVADWAFWHVEAMHFRTIQVKYNTIIDKVA
jgi:hypothetical protein